VRCLAGVVLLGLVVGQAVAEPEPRADTQALERLYWNWSKATSPASPVVRALVFRQLLTAAVTVPELRLAFPDPAVQETPFQRMQWAARSQDEMVAVVGLVTHMLRETLARSEDPWLWSYAEKVLSVMLTATAPQPHGGPDPVRDALKAAAEAVAKHEPPEGDPIIDLAAQGDPTTWDAVRAVTDPAERERLRFDAIAAWPEGGDTKPAEAESVLDWLALTGRAVANDALASALYAKVAHVLEFPDPAVTNAAGLDSRSAEIMLLLFAIPSGNNPELLAQSTAYARVCGWLPEETTEGPRTRQAYSGSSQGAWQAGSPSGEAGLVNVRGYTRKDGTRVRAHVRTRPDGNPNNNLSSRRR